MLKQKSSKLATWNWLKDMIGTDPDSMDDLRSVDIKAQEKGGVRLKRIMTLIVRWI